ncbi:MAG: helix-turn-helix transcriptional regulator, partial [Oleiphilaceae bacterium]|nr:helix-turn-helix transcriptional regulator [Oleiphilaceae bacterium]
MKNNEHMQILQVYQAAQQGTAALTQTMQELLQVPVVFDPNCGWPVLAPIPAPEAANDIAGNEVANVANAHRSASAELVRIGLDQGRVSWQFSSQALSEAMDESVGFSRLKPHLEQACTLASQLEIKRQRCWWSEALLDRIAMPVWLLDANKRLLRANRAAESWLRDSLASSRDGGRTHFQQSWKAQIGCMIDALAQSAESQRVFSLALAAGASQWAEVRKLPRMQSIDKDSAPLVKALHGTIFMVRVLRWEVSMEQMLQLQKRWGLTVTERDIVAQVLLGKCIKQIASQRGTSETTVRKQFKALMRKLKVHSQEQLLRLFCDDLALRCHEE